MEQEAIEPVLKLVYYGPLGILALLAILCSIVLYNNSRKDAKAHEIALKKEREECEKERKEHQDDLRRLEERYITKTETQIEKYNELATALKDVVGSAMRRYRRDSAGPGS